MKIYLIILLFLTASCVSNKYQKAIVKLQPTNNSKISGIVKITQNNNGISLSGKFENLNRKHHAFHIHQYGDITKKDGSGTGPHYYKKNYRQGHNVVGNLGRIKRQGKYTEYENYIDNLTINEIIGRSMVIHAKKGSKKSSKFVDSGKRVATGVIGVAK
tara:strand:+ start:17603 stop:18079 length:477 start_codon:yes stop_codon:yes gene_type:complete